MSRFVGLRRRRWSPLLLLTMSGLVSACLLDRAGSNEAGSTGAAGPGGGGGTGATTSVGGTAGSGAGGSGGEPAGGAPVGGGGNGGIGAQGGGGGSGVERCSDFPATDGVYTMDPDGEGALPPMEVYCDQTGGGWALLYSSVGSEAGTTTAFWQFPYAERLDIKGMADPGENYYAGVLYNVALQYRDRIEDLNGTDLIVFEASASGFDDISMLPTSPMKTFGDDAIYLSQLARGWSASDYDGDISAPINCSAALLNVAQHYDACFQYGLGADGGADTADGFWGPHLLTTKATELGLSNDGTLYTRVARITRWVRW